MLRFNEFGYLPPGNHELTFSELRKSVLVLGEDWIPNWDQSWRLWLVDNLEVLVRQLWNAGIKDIYINGSFCSIKGKPDDIDGYYVLPLPREVEEIEDPELKKHSVLSLILALSEHLNLTHEVPIWNIWEPGRPNRYGKIKSEMWHHFRCELFPQCWGLYAGRLTPEGHRMKFDEFFQKDRDGIEKGLIKLVEE